MLETWDIQHMKDTREEMTRNRTEDIKLSKRVLVGTDPFTGGNKYSESSEVVRGTWISLISQSGGEGEIEFENGVHVVTDDAIINLDISIDIEGVTKVERVRTGEQYVIKASDIKGIGQPNRHYILLELIT